MYHVLHEEEITEEKRTVEKGSDPAVPCCPSFLRKDKWKQKVAVKTWSKDIVCLPADYYSRNQELPIPWGSRRAQLAKAGLLGKVLLLSAMSEADIRAEIALC